MEQQQLTRKERRELKRQEKIRKREEQKKSRMVQTIALWSFIIIAGGLTIFGISKLISQTPDDNNLTASVLTAITDTDWVKGNKQSNITLIEYSDFQCPACGGYYPILKQLSQDFGDDINFVYRHFPLKQLHPNAELAARAAEAAGLQNKFWEMHDMIFENQEIWSNKRNVKEIFISYATTLSLDTEQFKNDLDSKDTKERVNDDYQSGTKLSIRSVPAFFLEGKKLTNPRTYEEFKNLIEGAIAKK